jgi:hypothetical protein
MAISFLAGCTTEQANANKDIKTAATVKAEHKPAVAEVYVPNPQVTDDSQLNKAGDSFTDRKGELTLKEVKDVNKTLTIGGIHYTIKNVKLMHYVPDYSMIDFYHPYTHDEEFDFVKVGIEIKNTSNENYHFAPIAMMNVNGTIHKTWEDDFYLEELNGEIAPSQEKKGNIGFIVEELDGMSEIEILSGDLVGLNKEKIADPVTMKIPF